MNRESFKEPRSLKRRGWQDFLLDVGVLGTHRYGLFSKLGSLLGLFVIRVTQFRELPISCPAGTRLSLT